MLHTVVTFTASNAPNVEVSMPYEYCSFKPAIIAACLNELGKKLMVQSPSRIHIEAWNTVAQNSFHNDAVKELVELCVMVLVVSSDGRHNKLDLLDSASQKAASFFCSLLLERNPQLKGLCESRVVEGSRNNLNVLNNLKQRYNSIANQKGMPVMNVLQNAQAAYQQPMVQGIVPVQQPIQQQQHPLINENGVLKGLVNMNGALQYIPVQQNGNDYYYQANTPQGLTWVKWVNPFQQQVVQQAAYQQPMVQGIVPVQQPIQQPVQQHPLINDNGVLKGLVNMNGALQYIPVQQNGNDYYYQANTPQGLTWIKWVNPIQQQTVQQTNMYHQAGIGGGVGANQYNPLIGAEKAIPVSMMPPQQTLLPDTNSSRFNTYHVDPTMENPIYADVSLMKGASQQAQFSQHQQQQQQTGCVPVVEYSTQTVQQPIHQPQQAQQPQPQQPQPTVISFNNYAEAQTGVSATAVQRQKAEVTTITASYGGNQTMYQTPVTPPPPPVEPQPTMTQAEFDRHASKPFYKTAINTSRFNAYVNEKDEQIITKKEEEMDRTKHTISICGTIYELDTATRADQFQTTVADFTKIAVEKVETAILASDKPEEKVTESEKAIIAEVLNFVNTEQIVVTSHEDAILEARVEAANQGKTAYRSRVVETELHMGELDNNNTLTEEILTSGSLVDISNKMKSMAQALALKAQSTPEKNAIDSFAIWINDVDKAITKDVNAFLALHVAADVTIDSFMGDMSSLRDWLSEQSILHLDIFRKWENSYLRALKSGIGSRALKRINEIVDARTFKSSNEDLVPSMYATAFSRPNSVIVIGMLYGELNLNLTKKGECLTKSHHAGLHRLCKAVITQQNNALERVVYNSLITRDGVEILFSESMLDSDQIILALRN